MKVTIYGSSSDGNCTIVSEGGYSIVLDCGIPIPPRVKMEGVLGVLITHHHSDHTNYMKEWISKPIYGTYGELNYHKFTRFNYDFHYVEPYSPFNIGPFTITPYHADHDTRDPVHYKINTLTDSLWYGCDACKYEEYEYLGAITCNKIMVECDYDKRILDNYGRGDMLYRRIITTHASNQYINERFKEYKKKLILCHLSRENNMPSAIKNVFGSRIRFVTKTPRMIR